MSLAVDLLIILVLGLAAYNGTRRGAILIGLELVCFALAAAGGLVFYRGIGTWLAGFDMARAQANIIAFTALWTVIVVASAIVVRWLFLRYLHRSAQLSAINQIGGAFLNIVKFALVLALALMVVSVLPLGQGGRAMFTQSYLAQRILAAGAEVQSALGTGLGQDIAGSLNFYTVTSAPNSTERIELGFTVKTGKVDITNETAMLELVNHERTTRGLPALSLNIDARTVARAYSLRMLNDGYFSHIDPDGHAPFDRLQAAGVAFRAAGENLALAPTLQKAHQGLMDSPGHRANILSPDFHKVGIGIIDAGQYGLMVTQNFTD